MTGDFKVFGSDTLGATNKKKKKKNHLYFCYRFDPPFVWFKFSCNPLISIEIGLISFLKKSNRLHSERWLKFHESGCADLLTTRSTSAVVFHDRGEVKARVCIKSSLIQTF